MLQYLQHVQDAIHFFTIWTTLQARLGHRKQLITYYLFIEYVVIGGDSASQRQEKEEVVRVECPAA